MNNHKNLILKIAVISSLIIIFNLNFNLKLNNQLRNVDSLQPKISGLTSPIMIDDFPGSLNNWTWAVSQSWCKGNGTFSDPYIIENITINGNNVGCCIEIKNSNKYFIIQNCTVYNSGNEFMNDAGLKLYNTSNGLLTKNNCSNHQRHGILLIADCINNTIQSNNISDNTYSAIVLCEGCEFNKVINNKLINNGHTIWLRSFKENIFSGNVQPCNYNLIDSNYINNSNFGAIFLQEGCSNNVINNNTIDLSQHLSIYLETVNGGDNFNNTISNNTISQVNDNAIEIYNCTYTKILENVIIDSKYSRASISQAWSKFSSIFSNQIKNCVGHGVYLTGCYNNSISENIIINNSNDGVCLGDSENNTISENTIQDNKINGISLYESHYNDIYDNEIRNNSYCGIYTAEGIFSSNNNLFYENFFLENRKHAVDHGFNNHWNSTTIGNFWDNYTGIDANDDGIGDTPHYIPGVSGSKDNYPIWEDGESVFPTIIRNSPSPPFTFGASAPVFNLTIFDLYLHMAWYKLNDTYTHFFTPVNGINIVLIDQDSWDSLPKGNLSIDFFVNDTNNNIVNIGLVAFKDFPPESPPEEPPSTPGIPCGYYYLIFLGIGILTLLIFQVKRGKYRFNIKF